MAEMVNFTASLLDGGPDQQLQELLQEPEV
jgi:hypothetical protein